MRSVADGLRADVRAEPRGRMAAPDCPARVAVALRLGDEDASALASARGITEEEARQVFARGCAVWRRPSPPNGAGLS